MGVIFTEEIFIDYSWDFKVLNDFNEDVNSIFNVVGWLISQDRKNMISNLIFDITTELWKLMRSQKGYFDTYNKWINIINDYIKNPNPPLNLGTINVELEEHLSNYIWRYYRILDFKLTKILNQIYNEFFDTNKFKDILKKHFSEDSEMVKWFNKFYKLWLSRFYQTRWNYTHHNDKNDDLYIFDWLHLFTDWLKVPKINFWWEEKTITDFMNFNTSYLINFSEEIIVNSLSVLNPNLEIFLNPKEEKGKKYLIGIEWINLHKKNKQNIQTT